MLRTPIPNADRLMLEHCGQDQLLGLFKSFLKTGSRGTGYRELPEAWDTLFSGLYLSADELVQEMQAGKRRLSAGQEKMLRDFISADCASGGTFVPDVIKTGGKIGRAALIMIMDLEKLAAIELAGTTALHLLADAVDRGARTALIGRAGSRLLSSVYDSKGSPVLFTIFTLGDLSRDDLDAIAAVFSGNELKEIMNVNRTGKNAFEVFSEASIRLNAHPPGERNRFFLSTAVKTTNSEGQLRSQIGSSGHSWSQAGAHLKADDEPKRERDGGSAPGAAERYESMTANPLDDMAKTMRAQKKPR